MKEKIFKLVDSYWKFDDNQQPIANWHDKQDLLKAIDELLSCDHKQVELVKHACKCKKCGKLMESQW